MAGKTSLTIKHVRNDNYTKLLMELFLIFSHSNIGHQSQNSVPQTRLKPICHGRPLFPMSVTARVNVVPHINRNPRSPGKRKC
jgi:hypothetical protein